MACRQKALVFPGRFRWRIALRLFAGCRVCGVFKDALITDLPPDGTTDFSQYEVPSGELT